MILQVTIMLAILTKSTHAIAANDSTFIQCSSTSADYVKQHIVYERVHIITEITQLATSIYKPGANLSDVDENVEIVLKQHIRLHWL